MKLLHVQHLANPSPCNEKMCSRCKTQPRDCEARYCRDCRAAYMRAWRRKSAVRLQAILKVGPKSHAGRLAARRLVSLAKDGE